MSQFYTKNYDSFVNCACVCVRERKTTEGAVELLLLGRINPNNYGTQCTRLFTNESRTLQLYFKVEEIGPEVARVCSELEFEDRLIWLQCLHSLKSPAPSRTSWHLLVSLLELLQVPKSLSGTVAVTGGT